MHTYSHNDRAFIIDQLTVDDLDDLLALDRLYYPPTVAWSIEKWQKLLDSCVYKLAVREIINGGSVLIGNMVVSVASGSYSAAANCSSFHINSITIHPNYLRQGHAKHLALELKNAMRLDPESRISDISIFVARNKPSLAMICEDLGFRSYEVTRNRLLYTSSIRDFFAKVDYKMYAATFSVPDATQPQPKSSCLHLNKG